jgi:hypothetical protein
VVLLGETGRHRNGPNEGLDVVKPLARNTVYTDATEKSLKTRNKKIKKLGERK